MRNAIIPCIAALSGCALVNLDEVKRAVTPGGSGIVNPTTVPGVPPISPGSPPGTPANDGSNTQVVLSYVTTRHSTVIPQFLELEKAALRAAAANGGLVSGATLKKSGALYVQTIQDFLTDSTDYAKTMNGSSLVDKGALSNLLNSFRSNDLGYIAGHYTGAVWDQFPKNTISSVTEDIRSSINGVYDLALFFPF